MEAEDDVMVAADDMQDAALKWLDAHPGILAEYEGEWVAVVVGRILAHGESFGDVVDDAKRQGFDDPLLVPVMPYPFIGGTHG